MAGRAGPGPFAPNTLANRCVGAGSGTPILDDDEIRGETLVRLAGKNYARIVVEPSAEKGGGRAVGRAGRDHCSSSAVDREGRDLPAGAAPP